MLRAAAVAAALAATALSAGADARTRRHGPAAMDSIGDNRIDPRRVERVSVVSQSPLTGRVWVMDFDGPQGFIGRTRPCMTASFEPSIRGIVEKPWGSMDEARFHVSERDMLAFASCVGHRLGVPHS